MTESVIDLKETLARVEGDTEILSEIVEYFLADTPGMMSEIRSSIERRDCQALERSSHLLKGVVSNFGAQDAINASRRLEEMGRGTNLLSADKAFADLEDEITRLQSALERFRKKS